MAEEIKIKYNMKNQNKIRIFGKKFVENNKRNCKIKIKCKERELTEFYDNIMNNEDILELNLIGISKICDMSHIFSGCDMLISLPNLYQWDTSNITNMENAFEGCSSLQSLPDISNWNIFNVINYFIILNMKNKNILKENFYD